jgi:hypothetical protein
MKEKKDKNQEPPAMGIGDEGGHVHPVNPFQKKEKKPDEKAASEEEANLEQQRKEGLTERD